MSLIPEIPPEMPTRGNWLTRGLGRMMLRLLGWRVVGDIPRLNKCMVAAAPHTSNWDFIVAMPAIVCHEHRLLRKQRLCALHRR